MNETNLHKLPAAGLVKRLLAGLYDWLLVIALMMVVSVPAVVLLDDAISPGNAAYRSAMVTVALVFFVYFWINGGQTLGMRAWRLRLFSGDGEPVTLSQALRRFAAAWVSALPAGLGFWWALFDAEGRTWHDRWSATRIVQLPPRKTAGGN